MGGGRDQAQGLQAAFLAHQSLQYEHDGRQSGVLVALWPLRGVGTVEPVDYPDL